MPNAFPPIISSLPEVDVLLRLVRGWLLQGETRQAVFFRLDPGAEVPEHSHGAQWGFVIDGELELTISGERRLFKKGDTYEIARGEPHGAACPKGALVLDVFEDPNRYSAKNPGARSG